MIWLMYISSEIPPMVSNALPITLARLSNGPSIAARSVTMQTVIGPYESHIYSDGILSPSKIKFNGKMNRKRITAAAVPESMPI